MITFGKPVHGTSTTWAYSQHVGYVYCCIVINWLNIMILFVIMFMLVVSLQVHSMYWPGVSCQISGKSHWKGVLSESRSCPHWCPYAMEYHYDVVPLPRSCHDRGPFMITKWCTYCSAAPCVPLGLANCCNINSDPLASIKRLFFCTK